MSTFEYMKCFLRDRNIASITPTSKMGVREVCRQMDLSKRVVIIEYGPATGVFTNYLLERITKDSLVIAIELNEYFANYLKKNIKDDRLCIHLDSAENIGKIMEQYVDEKADYVISGIPFSLLSPDCRQKVVQETCNVLKCDGKFLPYQTFFQKDEHLKTHLTNHFSTVEDHFILANLPPMRVYEAIKEAK